MSPSREGFQLPYVSLACHSPKRRHITGLERPFYQGRTTDVAKMFRPYGQRHAPLEVDREMLRRSIPQVIFHALAFEWDRDSGRLTQPPLQHCARSRLWMIGEQNNF